MEYLLPLNQNAVLLEGIGTAETILLISEQGNRARYSFLQMSWIYH